MSRDLALMSASELVRHYRRGTASPVEATQAALAEISRHNERVNAVCWLDDDSALTAARESEVRWRAGKPIGLIDGVPATVKDLLLSKGWPTLRGSRTVRRDQPWQEDAPSVARLRAHGAVLIGKTTTPEWGWKGVTDCGLTGVTRNPWNTEMTPGGSSGGAAVAAALGMGALHLGTDGGGSIRIPAGFTGIYGIKASFGRVPAYPASPFGTLSHVGPMTRTVEDAALMLSVIAEPDGRDWYSLPYQPCDWRTGLGGGLKGLRIAYSPSLGGHKVDTEVAILVAAAAREMAELGAEVEQAEPDFSGAEDVFRIHWYAGAANLIEGIPDESRQLIDPGLAEIAEEGRRIGLIDYFKAVKLREVFGQRAAKFHETYDLLLTPTLPMTAFAAGHEVPPGSGMSRWPDWTPFSYPFNLTRQPAATIPCGLTRSGLPVGLQIVGALYDEATVLRASRAYETIRPVPLPKLK
ncbi:MAG: amidase [Proteobacteria bacterium]|nr:amidase [Pseudomonadota bacterium]MBI3497494.1 amidase [Pseudomonadota bacterium]